MIDDEINSTQIDPIDQHTIECDLRAFTRWLNKLADQVNYLTNVYAAVKKLAEENRILINQILNRLETIEETLENHETRITNVEGDIADLQALCQTLQNLITMVNGRVDMLYGWLPIPYGMIDEKGWKFAMGDINVMSTQAAPSNTNGPGIYTSGSVENNDITFK